MVLYILYFQVKMSYSICFKNILGDIFIYFFIRDVDMLKRKVVVLEEIESFVFEVQFKLWWWQVISRIGESYGVFYQYNIVFGRVCQIGFNWFVCCKISIKNI